MDFHALTLTERNTCSGANGLAFLVTFMAVAALADSGRPLRIRRRHGAAAHEHTQPATPSAVHIGKPNAAPAPLVSTDLEK